MLSFKRRLLILSLFKNPGLVPFRQPGPTLTHLGHPYPAPPIITGGNVFFPLLLIPKPSVSRHMSNSTSHAPLRLLTISLTLSPPLSPWFLTLPSKKRHFASLMYITVSPLTTTMARFGITYFTFSLTLLTPLYLLSLSEISIRTHTYGHYLTLLYPHGPQTLWTGSTTRASSSFPHLASRRGRVAKTVLDLRSWT